MTAPGRSALAITALAIAVLGSAAEAWAPAAGAAAISPASVSPAATSPATHTFGLIAVGMPLFSPSGSTHAGGVDVYRHDGGKQTLTEAGLHLGGATEARFGSSVAVADLNNDGLADLLIGAAGPGRSAGRVDVALQSADGFTPAGASVLDPRVTLQAGERFGTALAVSERQSSTTGRDLWIGAPGRNVTDSQGNRVIDAGTVYRYEVTAAGAISLLGPTFEDDGRLPGPAGPGDRFGEVLAPADNGVVVGVPHKDIGPLKDAGEVVRLRTGPTTDDWDTPQVITQNSPRVPGWPQAGDRFGAAVSARGAAVGIPGEHVGKRLKAGAIQEFEVQVDRRLGPDRFQLTQNSAGIPGVAEAGDEFGASLARGVYDCLGQFSLAVGSPGEDIGPHQDAGSVTVFARNRGASDSCPSRQLYQGHGLPGAAEAGDALGRGVGTAGGDPAVFAPNRWESLLIGVPGEDVGSHRDTGRAVLWSSRGSTVFSQGFGARGGDRAGLRYGSVLGLEATAGDRR